jgi:F0F1-type ATP synthase assembly protein I
MDNDKNIKKPWWREGVLLSAKVSGYIAVPVIFASYVGKYLDKKYSSDPYLFLISIAIGFASTIYLIWKEVKIYQRKIDKEEKEKSDNK